MKYKRYFLLASVFLLASALFFACKQSTGGSGKSGTNNGTKKEQFAVTVAEESKTYVKFQDGYTAGTKKDKGEKVTFKVELPIEKELVKVTATTDPEPLTAVGEFYTVTLNADTEVKVETKEAEQFVLTVPEWNKDRFEFLDDYVPGTKKYKGEKVRFRVKFPADRKLESVKDNADKKIPLVDEVYIVELKRDTNVIVRLVGESGIRIDRILPTKYKECKNIIKFKDNYVERELRDVGKEIQFTIEPPTGMQVDKVFGNDRTKPLKPDGEGTYTVKLVKMYTQLRVELKPTP